MGDPKGSRSLLQHEPSPTRAECFVYAPSNEDFLSNISESNQELLRIAMDMDQDQFRTLTRSLRVIAGNTLDVHLSWNDQEQEALRGFLAKVYTQHPILQSGYQDAWPVRAYMTRYLQRKLKNGKRIATRHQPKGLPPGESDSGPTSSNIQSYLPKPRNIDALLDSTEEDFRLAVDFDHAQFRSVQCLLESLARKYLNINILYDNQDYHQRRLLVQEASKAEPSLSTKYEGAWPVHIYLKRYLRERARYAAKNSSCRIGEQSSTTRSYELPSTQTSGCVYRYPPMQPTHPQFTWSPATFSSNSSSIMSSTPSQASDEDSDTSDEFSVPPAGVTLSSPNANHSDKENVPSGNALTPMSAVDDPSAPVKEFLRSLNPNLECLLPRFRELGIEDLETLLAFKTWSPRQREELLRGDLNKLQLLAVQNFLRKA